MKMTTTVTVYLIGKYKHETANNSHKEWRTSLGQQNQSSEQAAVSDKDGHAAGDDKSTSHRVTQTNAQWQTAELKMEKEKQKKIKGQLFSK
jgi:hypothetical protein